MEEKEIAKPFFALFLETQELVSTPLNRTLKYPSDNDED